MLKIIKRPLNLPVVECCRGVPAIDSYKSTYIDRNLRGRFIFLPGKIKVPFFSAGFSMLYGSLNKDENEKKEASFYSQI